MTTRTKSAPSKTRVHYLTRTIRCHSTALGNLWEAVVRVTPGDRDPREMLEARYQPTRESMIEMLNEIDGLSALLREELGLEDR